MELPAYRLLSAQRLVTNPTMDTCHPHLWAIEVHPKAVVAAALTAANRIQLTSICRETLQFLCKQFEVIVDAFCIDIIPVETQNPFHKLHYHFLGEYHK